MNSQRSIIVFASIILIVLIAVGGLFLIKDQLFIPVEPVPPPEQLILPIDPILPEPKPFTDQPISFAADKHYFLDELVLIGSSEPRIVLKVAVGRSEITANQFQQRVIVKYFDGHTWTHKSDAILSVSADIVPTDLIPNWSTQIDDSRILKEKTTALIKFANTQIKIDTGLLNNEMSVRSLPEYTKFMSAGQGRLLINGQSFPVKVLASRTWSINSQTLPITDQSYYSTDNSVLTDWLLFWDEENNFYFADVTDVGETMSLNNYQSHAIGMKKSDTGAVETTFDLQVTHDVLGNPEHVTIDFGSPINERVEFSPINTTYRITDTSFKKWFWGSAEGMVTTQAGQTRGGFGIFEYIYN